MYILDVRYPNGFSWLINPTGSRRIIILKTVLLLWYLEVWKGHFDFKFHSRLNGDSPWVEIWATLQCPRGEPPWPPSHTRAHRQHNATTAVPAKFPPSAQC